MEQLDDNLLFRWFVGLALDAPVWDVTVFTKNRERLLAGAIAQKFLAAVLAQPRVRTLLSDDHFSVDGTLIEAWASMKSFRPKGVGDDGPDGGTSGGRNGERDFHGEKRSNETHASTTDPDARLYRKGSGKEAKLCYLGPCADGEPPRAGGRCPAHSGHRHGRARGGGGDDRRARGGPSDHARRRQELRHEGLRGRVRAPQGDAARDAEHVRPTLGDRRAHDPPSRLCPEPADQEADRGSVRVDRKRWRRCARPAIAARSGSAGSSSSRRPPTT